MGILYNGERPTFELAGREFSRITWYKDPTLRKLYICLLFVVLTSVSLQIDQPFKKEKLTGSIGYQRLRWLYAQRVAST